MNDQPNKHQPIIAERGAEGAKSDRRLFMQFMAFTGVVDTAKAVDTLQQVGIDGALYEDLHDPAGLALVTFSEDPDYFLADVRRLLNGEPFFRFTIRDDLVLLGRTYAIGYERDLDDVLIDRPKRTLLNGDWPWAVWYPVRRSGAFAQLPPGEQRNMLREHGSIGRAFGEADLAHDIRLACHGLDRHDNDFVIGLVGRELAPLSRIVETMRSTKQTSQYLDRLGPFFVGKKVWQRP